MKKKKTIFKLILSKRFARIITALIVVVIIFNLVLVIWSRTDKYFTFNFWQQYPGLRQGYLNSQYVSKHPTSILPDEIVNTYAGASYIRGTSPILIAPDTPPLGRYIIGLSALLFNNENIIPLFISIGALVMLYMLGMQVFSKPILALLPPLLFSFEPLFTNQLIYSPLLDTMQLFFLLCGFFFFNKGVSNQKHIISFFCIASIFLGFFISTKFYITGITIVAAWILTLLLAKKFMETMLLVLTLPLAIIILLLTYIRVLFDHYSFFKFLGIQKYVFLYHKSQLIYPFSIWALLLFNKWYVWFGNKQVISDPQWRITWPLVTLGSFITGLLVVFKKIKFSIQLLPLLLWSLLYVLFFSIGQVTARYFIILIPVLYLITIYGLKELYFIYLKNN